MPSRRTSEEEFDTRPWGCYSVLDHGVNYKVKRIEVLPGKRLSYQRHNLRAEHWYVIQGTGVVTLDGRQIQIRAHESIDIPLQAAHRIENTGQVTLIFAEVQVGDYFGEDDILRLEDDFGRAPGWADLPPD